MHAVAMIVKAFTLYKIVEDALAANKSRLNLIASGASTDLMNF